MNGKNKSDFPFYKKKKILKIENWDYGREEMMKIIKIVGLKRLLGVKCLKTQNNE